MDEGIKSSNLDVFSKLNYLHSDFDTCYEIYLLGSSRMYSNLNPFIIEGHLEKSTFNLGIDGIKIEEIYYCLEQILNSKCNPDLIVINIDPFSLNTTLPLWGEMKWYPYLNESLLEKIGYKFENSFIINHFPYLKYLFFSDKYSGFGIKSFLEYNVEENMFEKGFIRKTNQIQGFNHISKLLNKEVKFDFTKMGLSIFEEIQKKCDLNNINLIFVSSPILYSEFSEINSSFVKFKSAWKFKHNFLNFNVMNELDSSLYWNDPTHLNIYGAEIFTEKFLVELNNQSIGFN